MKWRYIKWKQEPTMECPSCKEITFEHTNTFSGPEHKDLEYICSSCNEVTYFNVFCKPNHNDEIKRLKDELNAYHDFYVDASHFIDIETSIEVPISRNTRQEAWNLLLLAYSEVQQWEQDCED